MGQMPVQAMVSGPLGAAGLSSLYSLQNAAKNPAGQRQKMAKICSEIEGVFLNQLMQQMRRTFVNSVDPQRKRTEFYQLCDQQMAQALAAGGGIGLARRLFNDLQNHVSTINKENQNNAARTASPSGEPLPAGDLPVSGTPGMSGTGSPGPDSSPGGDNSEPGHN